MRSDLARALPEGYAVRPIAMAHADDQGPAQTNSDTYRDNGLNGTGIVIQKRSKRSHSLLHQHATTQNISALMRGLPQQQFEVRCVEIKAKKCVFYY